MEMYDNYLALLFLTFLSLFDYVIIFDTLDVDC